MKSIPSSKIQKPGKVWNNLDPINYILTILTIRYAQNAYNSISIFRDFISFKRTKKIENRINRPQKSEKPWKTRNNFDSHELRVGWLFVKSVENTE